MQYLLVILSVVLFSLSISLGIPSSNHSNHSHGGNGDGVARTNSVGVQTPPPTNLLKSYQQLVEEWSTNLLNRSGYPITLETPLQSSTIKKSKVRRSVCRISEFSCSTKTNARCIPSDKYCNGVEDCGDGSDEPPDCTPCNRTYYGEWGSIYTLSLSSQQQQISPPSNSFVCQLTFAAAGDEFGDLVQINLDNLNIGEIQSPTTNGCPTGSLQVAEISRPVTGGEWCGANTGGAGGLAVYYSEMSAVALTLSIQSASPWQQQRQQGDEVVSTTMGTETNLTHHHGNNHLEYSLRLRYKFIPRSLAVVRYGLSSSPIERGELVPGSYCSRVLDSCHRKGCKLQSPNYPGIYPRNVSCYYTVRQRETPPFKKVLIQIIQLKPHKVQLRSIATPQQNNTQQLLDNFSTFSDCSQGNRDTLTIYDGTSTTDPVLLTICGGSYIPPITSSRGEVLVAFHSTPFGNPLEPKPSAPYPTPLRGFELDVEVVVVDSKGVEYVNRRGVGGGGECVFYFTSSSLQDGDTLTHPRDGAEFTYNSKLHAQEYGGNWISGSKHGVVKSPRHTLPPNSSCRYEFVGGRGENVWIYYSYYRRVDVRDPKDSQQPPPNNNSTTCTSSLKITDYLNNHHSALLASYCNHELPKLCDHRSLENSTRVVRACHTLNESYISAGARLVVEQSFGEGTALLHHHYQFNYEFVTRHQQTSLRPPSCSRTYTSSKLPPRGSLRTSSNVFDFGRGGAAKIHCKYNILMQKGESLQITIKNSSFGERSCKTVIDSETGRYTCEYGNSSSNHGNKPPRSELRIYEQVWSVTNATVHQNCICGNTSSLQFLFLGRLISYEFIVEGMRSDESYENNYVELDYVVNRNLGSGCHGDNNYLNELVDGGEIRLESVFSRGARGGGCRTYPYLIRAKRDHYSLYLRTSGFVMWEKSIETNTTAKIGGQHLVRPCPTTKNRILVYSEGGLAYKICPSSSASTLSRKASQVVEIYSRDYREYNSPLYTSGGQGGHDNGGGGRATFIIEFIGRELGSYTISWLELISARMKISLETLKRDEIRLGEAARAAAGGAAAPGATTNIISNQTLILDKKLLLEDPLFKSMFEGGEVDAYLNVAGETLAPCEYYCPELGACIDGGLWCDGHPHCPLSEADESSCDGIWLTLKRLGSPGVYVPVGAALTSALICCLLVLSCIGLKRLIFVKASFHGDTRVATGYMESAHRGVAPLKRDYYIDPPPLFDDPILS